MSLYVQRHKSSPEKIYIHINICIKIYNTMVYTCCTFSNALNSETGAYLQGKILMSDECLGFLACKRQRCRTSCSVSRHNQNCYSEIKYIKSDYSRKEHKHNEINVLDTSTQPFQLYYPLGELQEALHGLPLPRTAPIPHSPHVRAPTAKPWAATRMWIR